MMTSSMMQPCWLCHCN